MNELTRDAALIAQEINQIKADAIAAKYRAAFGKAMRMMAERVG